MRGKPKLIKLTDKNGNLKSPFWYIEYYDGRGKRKSTGCEIGKADHAANIALAAFTLERERPTARQPDQLLVAQVLKDYMEEHAQHVASAERAEYCEARLMPFFGNRFAAHVTPSLVNKYTRECQERKESNGTIRRDLEHLRAALNHEVNEQRLIYAPKFKLPPAPEPRERIITSAEVGKLLKQCVTPHLKAFVQIMLLTGQRPGAVESLTWFQVDFKERIIHFEKNVKSTNKRARPIYINHELMGILKALHKKKTIGHILEFKGKPCGNVKKAFARAVERAKLEGVTRYTLRHTVINNLDDLKTDDKTIADIAGHTNAKTTNRHYIKSKVSKQKIAMEGLTTQKLRKPKKGKS